ncbi:MAG: PHP domain-containing protein [Burkholderiales bacterium]|nr:MAG: PHP domain-containing protein [Burkholderiales bacterium]
MRHILIAAALALASCTSSVSYSPDSALVANYEPFLTLTGEITRADHQTYRELPFVVPRDITRLKVEFSYDKENRTVIDLGLRDPQGQRGWSGGNKSIFYVGSTDATPSYKPGRLQEGEWKLILGIPNIREGQTAKYRATITFNTPGPEHFQHDDYPVMVEVLSDKAGWYRGDFHTHTAHSDGSCDVDGVREPCPPRETFYAARDAGLDFVAVTDHNTITQRDSFFRQGIENLLLVPGTEITTFHGHANVIGNTDFLDFQLGSPRLPTLTKLLDQADAAGAFVSVNHPGLPSGEICMGCGWTVKDTDWSRVTAIEVANGSSLRQGGPAAGLRFWDNLLQQGHRLTAIGGSDNHDAKDRTGAKQPPIGYPTTAVYSSDLSTRGIIEGVKSGRVFIDLANMPGATLDVGAQVGSQTVWMGGTILLAPKQRFTVGATTSGLPADAKLTLIAHNLTVIGDARTQLDDASGAMPIGLMPEATRGYLRYEVRDSSGKILMIGNPIYVAAR